MSNEGKQMQAGIKEVTLTPEVVHQRLGLLEKLLTYLDAQFSPLDMVRQRQGPGMWSSVAAPVGFSNAYQGTLTALDTSLRDLRTQVGVMQQNLAASAATLTDIDQDIQDRLTALAKRIDAGPPPAAQVCTQYDVVPEPTVAPTSGGGGQS